MIGLDTLFNGRDLYQGFTGPYLYDGQGNRKPFITFTRESRTKERAENEFREVILSYLHDHPGNVYIRIYPYMRKQSRLYLYYARFLVSTEELKEKA